VRGDKDKVSKSVLDATIAATPDRQSFFIVWMWTKKTPVKFQLLFLIGQPTAFCVAGNAYAHVRKMLADECNNISNPILSLPPYVDREIKKIVQDEAAKCTPSWVPPVKITVYLPFGISPKVAESSGHGVDMNVVEVDCPSGNIPGRMYHGVKARHIPIELSPSSSPWCGRVWHDATSVVGPIYSPSHQNAAFDLTPLHRTVQHVFFHKFIALHLDVKFSWCEMVFHIVAIIFDQAIARHALVNGDAGCAGDLDCIVGAVIKNDDVEQVGIIGDMPRQPYLLVPNEHDQLGSIGCTMVGN